MSELTSGEGYFPERESMKLKTAVQVNNPGKVETDVPDVYADGTKDDIPVFDISHDDFMRNLRAERKRLRFKSDSTASTYLQGSRYKRPFYVRTSDTEGKQFLRKVSK